MKVFLTDAAYDDLLRIGQFIKKDDPARAAAFIADLHARCRSLGAMPRAFPLVPDHEDEGIRQRPYRDYLIFYRVELPPWKSRIFCMAPRTLRRCSFPTTDRVLQIGGMGVGRSTKRPLDKQCDPAWKSAPVIGGGCTQN